MKSTSNALIIAPRRDIVCSKENNLVSQEKLLNTNNNHTYWTYGDEYLRVIKPKKRLFDPMWLLFLLPHTWPLLIMAYVCKNIEQSSLRNNRFER